MTPGHSSAKSQAETNNGGLGVLVAVGVLVDVGVAVLVLVAKRFVIAEGANEQLDTTIIRITKAMLMTIFLVFMIKPLPINEVLECEN
jgi:hypothetical protein